MLRQLLRKPGPSKLPKNICDVLASQYRLDTQAMSRLRLLEKSGKYAGRPVSFIRIIDPALLTTDANVPLKYAALDNGGYKNAVQFEGHIEKQGLVLLNDRRSKQNQSNAVGAA